MLQMKVELYKHNQKIYDQVVDYLNSNTDKPYKRVGIVQDTGLGKTYIVMKLIEEYFIGLNVLYVAPTNALLHNISKYDEWKNDDRITMATYSSLNKIDDLYDVIILDEFHRAGAKVWNEYVIDKINNIAITIGLTATPIRYLDNRKDMRYLFDKVIEGLTLEDAVEQGIVKPFEKYVTSYFMNILNEKDKEMINEISKTPKGKIIEENMSIEKIIKNNCHDYSKRKWIIFFSRIKDMNKFDNNICNWFDINKDQIVQVSSKQSTDKNNIFLDEFKNNDYIRVIKCCNMFNEGIHISGVTGIVFLRKTISPIVYKQQLGRIVNVGEELNPIVFDLVGNIHSVSDTLNGKYNNISIENKDYENHYYVSDMIKKIFLNVYDYTIEVDKVLTSMYPRQYLWTKEEDDIILSSNSNGEAFDKLLKLGYNRTKNAISHRKRDLTGIGYIIHNKWSKEEDDIILSSNSNGEAFDKLLKLGYSRTNAAIGARKYNLTGRRYSVCNRWSKEEDDIILSSNSSEEAFGKLSELGYSRSNDAIGYRKHRLTGKGYSVSNEWTKEEDDIILSSNSTNEAFDKLSKLGYNRTKSAIDYRKRRLTGRGYSIPKKWTKEEDDIILSSNSTNEAFDKLSKMGYSRSNHAIGTRKHRLTGRRYNTYNKWSKEEDDIILSSNSTNEAFDKLSKMGYSRSNDDIAYRKRRLTGRGYSIPKKWTKEEDDIILSSNSISEAFDKLSELGHDRTKNAISTRKYKLTGTGYAMYCTWSKEEDDIILSSNSTNEAFDKLSKMGYFRTNGAIGARKYNLTGIGYIIHNKWSKEEDDIILSSNSTSEAFDKLSKMGYFRTNNAIIQRRSLLNKSNVKNN